MEMPDKLRFYLDGDEKAVDPLWITGFITLTAVLAYLFSIPETVTAATIIFFFTIVTIANPVNGVFSILITTPFFLSVSYRPFFYIIDIFVLGVILSAVAHWLINRKLFSFPLKYPVIFFVLAAAVSLPLDGKEFIYEYWTRSPARLFDTWLQYHQISLTNYMRLLFDIATSTALFFITYNFWPRKEEKAAQKIITAFIVMAVIISIVGMILFYLAPAERPDRYLTLSLKKIDRGVSAFAFNTPILVQYMAVAIFMSAGALYFRTAGAGRAFIYYISAIALFSLVTFLTVQRAGFIVILSLAIIMTVILIRRRLQPKMRIAIYILLPLTIAGLTFIADSFILDGRLTKFYYHFTEESRLKLWKAALLMFLDNPVLGAGLGRYTYFFPDYYSYETSQAQFDTLFLRKHYWSEFGTLRVDAHNYYLNFLAERGLVGLLSLCALLGSAGYALISFKRSGPSLVKSGMAASFALALTALLVHAMFNYVFNVRPFQLFFWISLAILGKMIYPYFEFTIPKRKMVYAAFSVLSLGLIFQMFLIWSRPVNPNYFNGFYQWEKQADGEKARWMGRKAVLNVKVDGDSLILPVSTPLPGLDKNPQKLTLWFGDYKTEEIFNGGGWRKIIIPVKAKRGAHIILWLSADHIYNPFKMSTGGDKRDLGVMVKNIEWRGAK